MFANESRGSGCARRVPGKGVAVRGPGLAAMLAVSMMVQAGPVQAGPVIPGPVSDPQGDFLTTYNPALPKTSDLDVRFAQVIYNPIAQTLTFFSQMWGPIGQTSTAIYVWGIDHGHGTEQFQLTSPQTGAGVFFDQVVVVRPPPGTTTLLGQTFTASVLNDTISLTVPVSVVPPTQPGDLPVERWGFNLWPRPGTPGFGNGNDVITDFAPNAADLLATTPEPASIVAMGSGLGIVLVVSVWRRRSKTTA